MELLAVIMVLSIIAAIAFPGLSFVLDGARMNTAVRILVTDIRYARQMAMGEGRNYYIALFRDLELYRIQVSGNPAPVIVKQVRLAEGVDLLGTTFPNDRFHFTVLGAPSAGGTITLQDRRGKVYSITILPATGRVRIYH